MIMVIIKDLGFSRCGKVRQYLLNFDFSVDPAEFLVMPHYHGN